MKRRTERLLLAVVTGVLAAAYGFLSVASVAAPHALADPVEAVPWAHWRAALTLLLCMWVPHVVLSVRRVRGDQLLLPLASLLVGVGWLEILRLSPEAAVRQAAWAAVGTTCFLLWMVGVRDYRPLQDYRALLLGLAVALQAATMLFGTEINGARLWIRIGPLSFQPIEVVKVLVVLYLASYLRDYGEILAVSLWRGRLVLLRYLTPLVILVAACELMLAMQRDLGIGLLLFGVFTLLFLVTTRRYGMVGLGTLLFAVLAWECYRVFPHVRVRFMAWSDPWADASGWGLQMVQSLYAIASGGFTGTGLGLGQPWNIPEVHTDFIFVALLEELGLVGAAALVLVYVLMVQRAFRIARQALAAGDEYGAVLAWGLGATVLCQSFIVIAGTIKMTPMTGITLPFVSYGGSSLLTNYLVLALLLQISHRTSGKVVAETPTRVHLRVTLALASQVCLLLLLVPLGYLTWFNLGPAPALAASRNNPRNQEDLRMRGGFIDRRGAWLGRTVQDDGGVRRFYPQGPLTCHTVGYCNPRYGEAGLEATLDARLRGPGLPQSPVQALRNLRGHPLEGPAAVLTLDTRLQKLGAHLLAGRRGAIVALDPTTGDILASVSEPGFDPDRLDETWATLSTDPRSPLVDRVSDGYYPPGSVFKLLTLCAALQDGVVQAGDTFYCPGYLDVGSYRLHCNNGEAHGTISLSRALAESCNVTFAQVALRLGAERFTQAMHDLLPGARLAGPATQTELAQMGFGQGSLGVSPLQVAGLVATIANRGVPVVPRLVRAWKSGEETTAVEVELGHPVLRPEVAETVTAMMRSVVSSGTGTAARLDKIDVAGKTGTAENPHGPPHAWFVAFAPASAPKVVVVVLVENAGYGGDVAAPIARQMIEAALSSRP